MERGDSPVGWSGDVELVVLYFVIRQHQLQKLGENASPLLKEQLIVRRGGSDYDVAPFFGLRAEVAAENAIHSVHGLRTPAEGQDRRIRFGGIVCVGKNHLIADGGPAHLLGLLQ